MKKSFELWFNNWCEKDYVDVDICEIVWIAAQEQLTKKNPFSEKVVSIPENKHIKSLELLNKACNVLCNGISKSDVQFEAYSLLEEARRNLL